MWLINVQHERDVCQPLTPHPLLPRSQHRPFPPPRCAGKLNLVDLAGSERFDLAHSSGEQYDEMVKINQSLM